MGIFLMILSVIGKVLLVLLLILLVLLCCILFLPIVYRGRAEKEGERISAGVSVSWLFRMVWFRLRWIDKKLGYELRLFGIPVIRRPKKSGKKDTSAPVRPGGTASMTVPVHSADDKAAEYHESTAVITRREGSSGQDVQRGSGTAGEKQTEVAAESEQKGREYTADRTQKSRENTADRAQESRKNAADRAQEGRENTADQTQKSRENVVDRTQIKNEKHIFRKRKKGGRLKRLLKKIGDGLAFVSSDTLQAALRVILVQGKKLLRHLLPRRVKGEISFGFSDPYRTGQLLAFLAVAYPWIPQSVSLYPDFEQEKLEGSVAFSGHIILIVVIVRVIKILLKKEVRKLIGKIRKKEA